MVRPSSACGFAARAPLAAALALVSGLLLGCQASAVEGELTVRIDTLAKASVPTGSPARIREVVRDAARYEAVWREIWGDREVGRPPVDFEREMVLVMTHPVDACLGAVEIEGIQVTGPGFLVKAGESRPHLCLCVTAETTFHVAKAPRLAGPADFETHAIRSRCE